MKPEDIEQMKTDRKAGTPGPWWLHGEMIFGPDDPEVPWQVAEAKSDCGYPDGCQTEPNARRIARVPTLKAEVLRWRALAEEFCRGVEAGHIRSTRTYSTMRAILNGDAP